MLTYKLSIAAPSTSTATAKTFDWTADSEIIQSIDLDLHREHKRLSTLQVRLWDPRSGLNMWPVYNSLPDPAFANVPIQLYLTNAANQATPVKVFDGKVTSLQPGYPGPSHVTIVAHDKSIDARMAARYKTYHNKSSLQIAQQISKDYGLDVDATALVNTVLTQRIVDIGMSSMGLGAFSDWDHLTRTLAVDGLELYMKGSKLYVRTSATSVYPTTFSPDDGNVISLDVQTNHVAGPGAGGQSKTSVPGGTKGAINSATGALAQEALKEGSTAVTHRKPPQGATKGHTGAHTESTGKLTEWAAQRRKRKDEATLTLRLTPDIGHQHLIALSGWGKKIDGQWYIESIHHSIAGNAGTTSIHLTTKPTSGSLKQAGVTQPAGTR